MEKYFAEKKGKDLLKCLTEKINAFNTYIKDTGLLDLWTKSYETYYGGGESGWRSHSIKKAGKQGELNSIMINDYRNIITHLLVMTTNQTPVYKTRAVNTDYKSQVQSILANGILEYYMNEKRVGEYTDVAAEMALVMGEGWTSSFWNATGGEVYDMTDTGAKIHEGEPEHKNYAPPEVVRDVTHKTAKSLQWVILKDIENKFDLAAKNPKLKEKILAEELQSKKVEDAAINFSDSESELTDNIRTYTFVHAPTDALPGGRIVKFINDEIMLIDSPLPFRDINIRRMSPGEILGTPFGYSIAFDLLGLSDLISSLWSIIATNILTFGVQNITAEEGANVNVKKLMDGMNLITHRKGAEPKSLNLTNVPNIIVDFLNKTESKAETLSGVNSVVRGNPEASLRSGNALALIASQTIQFSSGLQKAYAQHHEHVATDLVHLLQDFANVPKMANIVGNYNRSYMKEFKGSDIDKINRVVVELVSPVMRTSAGRLEVANNLAKEGYIKTPEQYIAVLQTGRYEPMIEGTQKELLNIRAENEELTRGNKVIATVTDMHPQHIQEHKSVLSDPEVRKNPQMVEIVTAHLQDHIQLHKSADPALLLMIGLQPLPQAPQAQGTQGGGQGQAGGVSPDVMGAPTQAGIQAGESGLPSMPKIAGTNEQYSPVLPG